VLHAFVVMPFGRKDGIDFDEVYRALIVPALEGERFAVFRADEERRAGNIRTDMFQELLLADLVVADLSVDNPNVWYELGVRHALRARGVIQIQCRREYMPFDIYVDRTLRYHEKDGKPDPAFLDSDRTALATLARETMAAWQGRRVSPVYHLLPSLVEPDWKSLRVGEAREHWEAFEAWERRIEVARRANQPDDILVLAEEAPTRALRLEARRKAGTALTSLGQFAMALHQFEAALTIDATDVESRRQRAVTLGRLGSFDAARVFLRAVVDEHPEDPESWALLGSLEKSAWIAGWRLEGARTVEDRRRDAAGEAGLLREAVAAYRTGFVKNPGHYYAGINMLTLAAWLRDLTGEGDEEDIEAMAGALRWAVLSARARNARDYWARATLGELETVVGETKAVERAFSDAVAVAEKNWFWLRSTREQLQIARDLDFRPAQVDTALRIVNRALERLRVPSAAVPPRTVILFSGHMIDRPDRAEPRFPAALAPAARQAIEAVLAEWEAGPADRAITSAACGGDLLFAEAALARGVPLDVRIPSDEARFLDTSVSFAGPEWREAFDRVRSHPDVQLHVMPARLGPVPPGIDAFDRLNRWLVSALLITLPARVRFLALWDGREGDGPGSIKQLHDAIRPHATQVRLLAPGALMPGAPPAAPGPGRGAPATVNATE
jgi:tetratricopeptide (TPR) repeat protein